MTVPQFALYLIGEKRVARYRPLSESYTNSVWYVSTRDEQGFFVKKCANPWAWENEVRAHNHLHAHGIPGPSIYAAYGTTIVFADSRMRPPVIARESTIRGSGRMLRRLHDSGSLPETAMNPRENTLVLNVLSKARKAGYEPPSAPVPTHGDCHPKNILVQPGGRVSHLIDFEEFRGGDALIDLMIAAIECCRFSPARMSSILTWLSQGYFAWDDTEPRLTAWRDTRTRMILAHATCESLIEWAEFGRFQDEADDLKKAEDSILAAVEVDTTFTSCPPLPQQ